MFNTLLPVAPIGSRAGFALGTWNARSFFCREPSVFNRKLQLLGKQIKIHNIFCLQEVRGSDALVKKHLRLIARTHWIFCNFSRGRKNAGGVITFVSKSSVPDEACVHHTPLVAGRVSRLLIKHTTVLEPDPGPKAPTGREKEPNRQMCLNLGSGEVQKRKSENQDFRMTRKRRIWSREGPVLLIVRRFPTLFRSFKTYTIMKLSVGIVLLSATV